MNICDPQIQDDNTPKESEKIWEILEASKVPEDVIKQVDAIVMALLSKIGELETGIDTQKLLGETQVTEREAYIFNVMRNQDTEYEWREMPGKQYKSIRWCHFIGEQVLGEGSTELEAAENSLKIWKEHQAKSEIENES